MTDEHSEASKLLEAALEQMDGIIQGAKFDFPSPPQVGNEDFRLEERLRNSENERNALRVQVSLLNTQIQRQSERIAELESLLHNKKSHESSSPVPGHSELDRIKVEFENSQVQLSSQIQELQRENSELRVKAQEALNNNHLHIHESPQQSSSHQSSSPLHLPPKGIKKILGKMKRSNSGSHLEGGSPNLSEGRFKRGGTRATVGGRLERPGPSLAANTILGRKPFMEWNVEALCVWMETLGLAAYNSDMRRCIVDGKNFSSLNINEYESKLGMKNPLHRKKVYLALSARVDTSKDDSQGRLDNQWVLRWLDDVGLPQYKDVFLECRIDGRVLNMLTLDDLFYMRISNQLHHLSFKRGIQVLRLSNFEPNCLARRGVSGESPGLWSNFRVMEWLKEVDLSEYSPNLRGSGVHGGLFIHEPRFDDELLASILSIHSSKTLLRRHLSIRFKELVGNDVMGQKRSSKAESVALTPTTKAKFPSRVSAGQFSLKRKKSKSLFDYDDLICPFTKSSGTGKTA